jgi:tyrosine-protein phosphatase SIW14
MAVPRAKNVRRCNPEVVAGIIRSRGLRPSEVDVRHLKPIFYRCAIALCFFALPALAGPSAEGINNFRRVDEHVYRGAQPTNEGFNYLAKIGVKTVVDLRERGDRADREARLVTSLGMQYVNVPMSGLTPPTEAEITRILGLLEDVSPGAVFVHCMRGADRTGAVIAAYRIDHNHWDNAQALNEAMSCGMSFFQIPRQSYIRNFHPLTIQARSEPSNGPPNRGDSGGLALADPR